MIGNKTINSNKNGINNNKIIIIKYIFKIQSGINLKKNNLKNYSLKMQLTKNNFSPKIKV